MTDYKKYLKNVKPEEFIEALNSRIKQFEEEIKEHEKELFELKKKKMKAKGLEELNQLESEIFWANHFINSDKEKLFLIDDILQKLGSSIGFKRKWKERGEK